MKKATELIQELVSLMGAEEYKTELLALKKQVNDEKMRGRRRLDKVLSELKADSYGMIQTYIDTQYRAYEGIVERGINNTLKNLDERVDKRVDEILSKRKWWKLNKEK